MTPRRIVLAGTGNVACHLARALGNKIMAVAGRDIGHARQLAADNGIPHAIHYGDIAAMTPDLLIMSIADNALGQVVDAIGAVDSNPLVVHTSGTLPKEMLAPISPRTGVLYPLQTFSKGVPVDMTRVPFFTEAVTAADHTVVDEIAHAISSAVHHADAAQRRVLHVAGVFSSNFVNILLEMVEDVLAREDYPLSTVRPLVEATVEKAFSSGPHKAQTGPARRGDAAVMAKHAASLPDDKRQVYELLSQYIIRSHNVSLK